MRLLLLMQGRHRGVLRRLGGDGHSRITLLIPTLARHLLLLPGLDTPDHEEESVVGRPRVRRLRWRDALFVRVVAVRLVVAEHQRWQEIVSVGVVGLVGTTVKSDQIDIKEVDA